MMSAENFANISFDLKQSLVLLSIMRKPGTVITQEEIIDQIELFVKDALRSLRAEEAEEYKQFGKEFPLNINSEILQCQAQSTATAMKIDILRIS